MIFTLTGCAEIRLALPLSDDTLLSVSGVDCPLSQAVFRLMEVKDYYRSDEDEIFWDRAIGDTTFEGYIKDSVEEEIIRLTASVTMAEENAVYLDDTEIKAYEEEAASAYDAVSALHDLSAYGITANDVRDLYEKIAIYNKLFEKLSENVNFEISDTDTKVIKINYVEIPSDVSINQAEEFRKEVRSGTSFETACRAMGWSPVMNQVMTMGDMPEAFENVAYELIDGELSEIVETAECMYVIQCIEDYMISESVANKNSVITSARQAAFDECFYEFSERNILRFNTTVWDKIVVTDL